MAKEIGLKLKISSTGGEKVINNLQDLENELQALQTQLKSYDFGSAQFQETARNIQILKSRIEDVDKATEGVGIEKRLTGIAAAAGVLTGSFAVLQGVVATFVSSEEDLKKVQEAETKALAALNIVLGVREISEGILEGKIVARQLAEKAATIATKVATAAQAAFNRVLALNPIGLVITAIAALTTAYIAFSSETKKATKSFDELKVKGETLNDLTERSIKTRDEELKKVQSLIAISEIENLSKEDRVKVLKEIQSQYPNYLKNQNLEKVSLEQIKSANDKLTEAILKVARARAAADKLGEIQAKKIEIETNRQLAVENQRQQEQAAYNLLNRSQTDKQIQVLRNLGKVRDDQAAKSVKELDFQEKVILNYIKENDLTEELADGFVKAGEASKTFTNLTLKNIQQQINQLGLLNSAIEKYGKTDLKVQAQILELQTEVLQKQKDFIKEYSSTLQTNGEKVVQSIQDLFFKTILGEEEANKLKDGYLNLFNVIDKAVKSGEIQISQFTGFQSFVDFAETKLPGISKNLVNVSDEGKLALVDYFKTLEQRVQSAQGIIEGVSKDGSSLFVPTADIEQIKALRQVEEDYAKALLSRVQTGRSLQIIDETTLQNIQSKIKLNNSDLTIQQELGKIATKQIALSQEYKTATDERKKQIEEENKALEEQAKKYNEVSNTLLEQIKVSDNFVIGLRSVGDEAEKNAKKIEEFKKIIDAPVSPEQLEGVKQFFKDNADAFDDILTDIFNNADKYFQKFGKDGIQAILSGLQEGIGELDGKSRAELEKIQSYLTLVGDEFADQFGLEDNPFLKLLAEISKKLKELPTESQESFNKTLKSITDVATAASQALQDIFGRYSQILQGQTSLALEQLEYQTSQTLATIGEANTESAEENKKIEAEREKVQKQAAQRRFEIEKQGRVQELQFAIANAIAQGATAILNALALPLPPPAPQIYAGVVAGLTAAQIAVINDQLRFAQSKTFVGRRGGMIMGQSHEGSNGGVPALLEGGEFVVNREAVKRFSNELQMMNNSTGGRAVQIDDSRLVQAIASQNMNNKAPLKAYVLYNEIQDTDKLNKKIQQLSTL